MKESIGGTQIFILVVALVLIFSGIMALTINRSNAFSVKDQLVSIIEREGRFDMESEIVGDRLSGKGDALTQIVESLEHNSYRQLGRCPESEGNTIVTAYQRNGSKVSGDNKASFCVVRISGESPIGAPPVYYYQVIVFYTLDLPVLNTLFNFRVVGETKALDAY